MCDCMTFPDTVEEFMEQYKITDTEHVYTNGIEMIPVFRMKQWFEHLSSAQPENEKRTAETAQNVPNGDLISRKMAIDLIEDIETKRLRGEIGLMYAPAIKGLKALPSAQPDLQPTCNQLATDCISRQAAIDAINTHFGFNIEEEYGSAVQEVVNGLPSAQPEIIRCKDCKHYGRADKRRFYRGMDCLNKHIDTIVPDRDFCSKAERRTDEQT